MQQQWRGLTGHVKLLKCPWSCLEIPEIFQGLPSHSGVVEIELKGVDLCKMTRKNQPLIQLLHNRLWCFVFVAKYTLMIWENNLFSSYFLLRPLFSHNMHFHIQKWSAN
jgi:hypothetical protein